MKILFLILCTFLAYKNINACEYKPIKNITLEYLITSSLFVIFYFICIFLAHEIIRIYANKNHLKCYCGVFNHLATCNIIYSFNL